MFVNYENTDLSNVAIGQFPDNVETMLGNTYTVSYGFMANEKVEMLEIAVTISEPESALTLPGATNHGIISYTNPVQNELKVVLDKQVAGSGTVSIFTVNGEKVITKHVSGAETETINLGQVSSGIYFLNYSNGLTTETVKLIKK
ncbi:MAG: T9SS type A sorting domain-containing protein [Prolixibacteraceae bacterium]|nr:T9SS type A sorting domain-containing protein [Prolixibacteraceae bacterium]